MNNYMVYMHISPSNKRYIGITRQKPEYRWRNGSKYKHNRHFTHAINKYGWDNLEHIIFAENLSQEDINDIKNEIPLERIGKTIDIAKCVKWLIEDEYTTGQIISPNGGWVI